MSDVRTLSRREFLQWTGVTGSGLMLACSPKALFERVDKFFEAKEFKPNIFISITTDQKIKVVCARSEMGQGTRTAMTQLIAEELEVALEQIELRQAEGDVKYGDQNTDGSTSVRNNWKRLRDAGAMAREMLIRAAAKKWNVPHRECYAENGFVIHSKTKSKSRYSELAELAMLMPIPKKIKLKKHKNFKVIGKNYPNWDVHDMTRGKAVYGIDVDVPEMVYACLLRAPTLNGRVKKLDDSAARKVPGVVDVFQIDGLPQDINTNNAVAVVAKHSWAAIKGRDALKVEWVSAGDVPETTEEYKKTFRGSLNRKGKVMREVGKVKRAFARAHDTFEAVYEMPYQVHAQLEPLSAVAHIKEGICTVHAPVQRPQWVQTAISNFLRIDKRLIDVNVTLLGGAFGRKAKPDFVIEAVAVAKKINKPVKLFWTREDDMRHGFYHAQNMQRLEAAITKRKKIIGWKHKSVFPTLMTVFNPQAEYPSELEMDQGCTNISFRIPNIHCEAGHVKSSVRVGWVRSVCNIFHSFGVNCFVDELAAKLKTDPVAFRLKLLGRRRLLKLSEEEKLTDFSQDTGRLSNVIRLAAQKSHWELKRPKGIGVGLASHYSFYSYVAMAIEVAVKKDEVKIRQIDCAVDCGSMVNPDNVRAQVEGAVLFGLSMSLFGKITVTDSKVDQSNFHDYRIMRMKETPKINIHLVENTELPTGIGEPGVPPVAPALYNAIYAATGKRIRSLPLEDAGFTFVPS